MLGASTHTQQIPLRYFLVSLLENPVTDQENIRLALTLLLKIGTVYSHPELLASAALHMLKHDIDLSKEIQHWVHKPEVYDFQTSVQLSAKGFEHRREKPLSPRIDFGGDASTS